MSYFEVSRPRGDTIRLRIAITRADEGGVRRPVDLTQATLAFSASLDPDTQTPLFRKVLGDGIDYLDAPGGVALVTIPPGDTEGLLRRSELRCDAQLDEIDGVRTTVAEGLLTITVDVTRGSAS